MFNTLTFTLGDLVTLTRRDGSTASGVLVLYLPKRSLVTFTNDTGEEITRPFDTELLRKWESPLETTAPTA